MKVVAFIEETKAIEKILRHCELWKEPAHRPPMLQQSPGPPDKEAGPVLDYSLLEQNLFWKLPDFSGA